MSLVRAEASRTSTGSPPASARPAPGPRRLTALAPRGWRHFLLQVALLGSFTFVYALSGLYGRREWQAAFANSRELERLERSIGIAWEHPLQHWVLHAPRIFLEIANYAYFNCQFTASTLFLLWAYARHNERFGLIRDALLAANYVSLIVLFIYPAAPPRLLPGGGFTDTLDANSVNLHSSFIDALNNPYSAMPSLHVSYAIVLGVAGFSLTRRRWAKLLWALYPSLVIYSVVATGNHFLLDVIAGALALLATPVVSWASARIAAAAAHRHQLAQLSGQPAWRTEF